MKINRQDTNGVKPLLQVGELGYDNWSGGGDVGRVYVGNGASNIALAKKSEVDVKVVANVDITAGTATKVTYDAKGLVTAGTTLSAGDIPVLDAGKITTGTLPVVRGGTGTTASTGTGNVVLSTSPVLVTPTIGVATGTSFNSITGLSSATPVMDGTATAGTGVTVARADHVHPKDTTKVDANANITAGTYKSVTVDVKGLVTGGTNPTTISGYGITDAYTKAELNAGQLDNRYYTETEVNAALALKVDDTEIASVNLLRADKYLAAQNVVKMTYDINKKLIKVQYNNPTDIDYEVLSYTDGKLTNVAHYVGSVLKGNTVLTYVGGLLDDAPFIAV